MLRDSGPVLGILICEREMRMPSLARVLPVTYWLLKSHLWCIFTSMKYLTDRIKQGSRLGRPDGNAETTAFCPAHAGGSGVLPAKRFLGRVSSSQQQRRQ